MMARWATCSYGDDVFVLFYWTDCKSNFCKCQLSLQSYADEGHDLRGVLEHVYRSMEDFLTECLSLDTDEAKVTQDTWELPPIHHQHHHHHHVTAFEKLHNHSHHHRGQKESHFAEPTTWWSMFASDNRCERDGVKNVRFVIINHNRVIYIIVQISELRV